jgi:hypothetical protein
MERKTSSLMIKSNRVLGTRLVEAGLTTVEEMDKANEDFIGLARAKDIRRASLLRLMIYDHQSLAEESLLDYQLEHYPVGAVMLENYDIDEELYEGIPLELMRTSWTLPIDRVGNRWFLATAYYMSDVVRNFWEERLDGRINWYISSMSQLELEFEAIAAKQAELAAKQAAKQAAEQAAKEQPESSKA